MWICLRSVAIHHPFLSAAIAIRGRCRRELQAKPTGGATLTIRRVGYGSPCAVHAIAQHEVHAIAQHDCSPTVVVRVLIAFDWIMIALLSSR